jgi:carbamoyltransferase
MNILGLNGWKVRSHDAAACIVKDGRLIFAVEEERITRKKHSFDLPPIQSTLHALQYSNLTIDDIDLITFGWDITKLFNKKPTEKEIFEVLLPRKIFSYKRKPKIIFVPHHLAHAYYAYYSSPFVGQQTNILILDGQGEEESISLGSASGEGVFLDGTIPASQSLGYFYGAVCRFLGYSNLDGGKLMGLAPYGRHENVNISKKFNYYHRKISNFPKIATKGIDIEEKTIAWWLNYFEKSFHLKPFHKKYIFSSSFRFEKERNDNIISAQISIAHTAQQILEKIILQMSGYLQDKYKNDKLVLAGGVALNCSANQKIQEVNNIKIHIPSSPADSGVAIGSAIYGAIKNKETLSRISTPYLGSNYHDYQIKEVLNKNKIIYKYTKKPEELAALLLKKNYLIGWFQGRAEFGPRALGNRSILANPLFKENHERLNKLKGREQWRPLGISITEEEFRNYFEGMGVSPYMMITAKANKRMKKMCPAIIHVDGTSRPQLVKKKDNPLFYSLIKSFGKRSTCPFVINTSFNRYDEPIVNSPEDAIRTFFTTSLDVLILNHYVIFKR